MIGVKFLSERGMLALLALGVVTVPVAAARAPQAPRSVVPIREVVIRPNGTPRYAVTLRINGVPVETGLDTGSIGLRILPRAVRRAGIAPGSKTVRYSYGSGVQLDGRVARAMVQIGAVRGAVPLQAIDRAGCVSGRDCPAAKLTAQAYGLMGSGQPGQGFEAIMGTRQMTGEVPNPLAALGVRRWIVHLPQRGGRGGVLILNPTPADMAGFVQLRAGAGAAGTVGACAAILVPGARRLCGPTLLDTGAPGLLFRGTPRPLRWQKGQVASIILYSAGGNSNPFVRFRIGDEIHGATYYFESGEQNGLALSAGVLPFYAYDVLFDRTRNAIAVRPNRSARAAVRPSNT